MVSCPTCHPYRNSSFSLILMSSHLSSPCCFVNISPARPLFPSCHPQGPYKLLKNEGRSVLTHTESPAHSSCQHRAGAPRSLSNIPLSPKSLYLFPLWSPCPPPGPLSRPIQSTRKMRFLKHMPNFSLSRLKPFSGSALHSR